jgi:hypothetical protein
MIVCHFSWPLPLFVRKPDIFCHLVVRCTGPSWKGLEDEYVEEFTVISIKYAIIHQSRAGPVCPICI